MTARELEVLQRALDRAGQVNAFFSDLPQAEANQRFRAALELGDVGELAEVRLQELARLVELADGVHLVRGVRTGFQHLVVETGEGLIVADAPAGWVELHQVPPTDLVPGLGISGLSENFVDFLAEQFPEQPIRAVALTHAHDDHAGGARAFAAQGAVVFAPAEYSGFLEGALGSDNMPPDRFSSAGGPIDVVPVSETVTLSDPDNTVRLLSIGAGPHASASLGVHAIDAGYFFVSDLHVPDSEDVTPRSERAVTECWFAIARRCCPRPRKRA